jgi:hypothetical protein
LAAAFPRAKMPKESIAVYVASLSDLNATTLQMATVDIVATSEWFPTIAQIRRTCAGIEMPAPDPDTAYLEICHATLAISRGEIPVEPTHQAIHHATKTVGGLRAVLETRQPQMMRAQWQKAYEREVEYLRKSLLKIPLASLGDSGTEARAIETRT